MTVSGIELGKAIIHQIAGHELALRTVLPPGATSTIAINADEIAVQLPAVRLVAGPTVTVSQKVYLDFFINTTAARAIVPSFDLAPPRPDGNQVVVLRVKPAIDPTQLVAALRPDFSLLATSSQATKITKLVGALL